MKLNNNFRQVVKEHSLTNRGRVDEQGRLVAEGEQLKNGIWPQSFPLWIVGFYILFFIIRPWEQMFPWLGALHFERTYAIFMIMAVFFSNKRTRFQLTSQDFTVLLFFGAIIVSSILAFNLSLAWNQLYIYITLVIVYFIFRLVIRTIYELVFVVSCYILAMALYLAKSQWEYFIHGQRIYDQGVYRLAGISSTLGGPNSLAMSIVVTLPLLVFLWSIRKELTYGWPKFWRNWYSRFLSIYLVLAVSSIILTNSRMGMLSFVLFILLNMFRSKNLSKKITCALLGAFILAVIWQVMPNESKGRFRTIWAPEEGPANAYSSAMGRVAGFWCGIDMFKRFPFSGVGIGNFVEYRVRRLDGVPLNAHNLLGQALGETGLIGSVTFFIMVLVTLSNYRGINNIKRNYNDSRIEVLSNFTIACRNSLILLAFDGLFGNNMLRFNWLWLAAFGVLALQQGKVILGNAISN